MDINKIVLTGIAETSPILSSLPQSKTPVCFFTLRVDERFLNNNNLFMRPNYFRVESLGKQARYTYEKVVVGGRYLIDGYLRQESNSPGKVDIVKVRTYGVIPDPTTSSMHYREGVKRALQILSTHQDVQDAIKVLREIVDSEIKEI